MGPKHGVRLPISSKPWAHEVTLPAGWHFLREFLLIQASSALAENPQTLKCEWLSGGGSGAGSGGGGTVD